MCVFGGGGGSVKVDTSQRSKQLLATDCGGLKFNILFIKYQDRKQAVYQHIGLRT